MALDYSGWRVIPGRRSVTVQAVVPAPNTTDNRPCTAVFVELLTDTPPRLVLYTTPVSASADIGPDALEYRSYSALVFVAESVRTLVSKNTPVAVDPDAISTSNVLSNVSVRFQSASVACKSIRAVTAAVAVNANVISLPNPSALLALVMSTANPAPPTLPDTATTAGTVPDVTVIFDPVVPPDSVLKSGFRNSCRVPFAMVSDRCAGAVSIFGSSNGRTLVAKFLPTARASICCA